MYLGLISDTHGETTLTRRAAEVFRRFDVGCVLHCGDIGNGEVVRALRGLPVHYVFGNCDGGGSQADLRMVIEENHQHVHGMFGRIEREGKRIFFLHGHQAERFAAEVESQEWDMICYGHTHVRQVHIDHGTLLVNPGALYRVARASIIIVELPGMNITPVLL